MVVENFAERKKRPKRPRNLKAKCLGLAQLCEMLWGKTKVKKLETGKGCLGMHVEQKKPESKKGGGW